MNLWNVENIGIINFILELIGCYTLGYQFGYTIMRFICKDKEVWNEDSNNCNSGNTVSKILCATNICNVLVRIPRLAKRKTQTDKENIKGIVEWN